MSNKKKVQKNIAIGQETKYVDNEVIENYVSGDIVMHNCLEQIKDILKNEHCSNKEYSLFKNELALNLDNVEIAIKKGTSYREPTVDFVVGLENSQLLLTEAKYLVDNMENIAIDIDKKIKHSKDLLTSNPNFGSIYKKKIILLNSKNFEQKRRRLMNLLNNDVSYYPSTSIEFYSKFFEKP